MLEEHKEDSNTYFVLIVCWTLDVLDAFTSDG